MRWSQILSAVESSETPYHRNLALRTVVSALNFALGKLSCRVSWRPQRAVLSALVVRLVQVLLWMKARGDPEGHHGPEQGRYVTTEVFGAGAGGGLSLPQLDTNFAPSGTIQILAVELRYFGRRYSCLNPKTPSPHPVARAPPPSHERVSPAPTGPHHVFAPGCPRYPHDVSDPVSSRVPGSFVWRMEGATRGRDKRG